METRAPGPEDDPFEWLGRGILTDQRDFVEQNSTKQVTGPKHDSTEIFAKGNNNNHVTNPHAANLEDDPFETLARGILTDQPFPAQQNSKNDVPGPGSDTVSNPRKCDEILVEDVVSVDENQLDVSDVPESDVSYVPEELFPSAASHKLAGVPSTINEEDFTGGGVSNSDTIIDPSPQQAASADIEIAADCTQKIEQDHSLLFNQCERKSSTDECKDVGDHRKACAEDSDGSIGKALLSLIEAPTASDAPPSVITSSVPEQDHQHQFIEADLLQLSTNESDLRWPSTETHEPPQIRQVNSNTAPSFTGSLFELPLENTGYQNIAPPDRAPFAASAGDTYRFNSDTGLQYSSPLFEVPLENIEYQQTPPPLIDIATTDEMNFGIAQSNPSAAATITTAASTNVGDDSDSAKSEILRHKEVPKDNGNRCLEESYALFNDDEVLGNKRKDYVASDQGDSIDSPDEFLMTTSNKGRGSSSCSRNNHNNTSLDSDEENAITPGMVGYTGFDEDDESMSNKKSRKRASYKKLRRNSITEAKPKTRKIMCLSVIVVIALVAAVSILLSLVLQKTREISSNSNDASGFETNDSVDIVANTGTNPTGDSDMHTTTTSHVQGHGIADISESTAPSIQPSHRPTSSAPSLSLVETAFIISTVFPSYAPELPSAAPTIKPTGTIVYPTSTPSIGYTSSRPSLEDNNITTESTGMLSTVPSSALRTLMPSSVPTSAPTIFNLSTSFNLTDSICNVTVVSSNISELVAFDSGDQPCATFFVDLCTGDFDNRAQWAIVQQLRTDELSPSPTPKHDDDWNYDDDWHYDDDWNYDDDWSYDDALFDDFLSNHSAINDNQQENNSSMSHQVGAYFSDQNVTITGNNSAKICLPKGTYNFIMSESTNEFALYFSNGRPVRPMSAGNYSEGMIDVTAFEVTTFDVLGLGTNSTSTPLSISEVNASSSHDDNSTGLITSSGDDLVRDIGKAYGIIFEVETGEKSLGISSIELYLDTSFPAHYEVHTKAGSWKQDEVLSGFREISHGAIVGGGVCQDTKNCTFARIPNEDFDSFVLPSGSRQSFYVTSTTDDLVFQHFVQDGAGGIDFVDIVQASNPELTVYLGAAVLAYPLELADPATDFRAGGFIGRLVYEVLDAENVSLHDNFVPEESEPTSQTEDECYYYTEESCRNAAQQLGLSLGGSGFPFAGHFGLSGCYFYPCSNCMFGGHAYFGKSSDKTAMETMQASHSERRLDCTTNVDNLSKDTSFWCLFPSNICRF